uniref:L-seryl-tRNA(Sec) kinase n=1 Tax=Romanomermis culicivorax TaxID=13658 RepID=A0A915KF02_ROMCU
MKITLIVVCGLPGSGKTTFCNKLRSSNMFPEDIILHDIKDSWKKRRNDVQECVSRLLATLKTENCDSNFISTGSNIVWPKFSQKIVTSENSSIDGRNILILLDDNMYYNSMRLRYYNLALEKRTYFGQIYVKCDLETCLQRNAARKDESCTIPKDVIIRMSEIFEEPNPLGRSWERNSMIIAAQDLSSLDTLGRIKYFFRQISESPLPENNIDQLADEKLKSRYINESNKAHQVDIIFRKAINQIIKEKRNLGYDDTSSLFRKLTEFKKYLMDGVLGIESLNIERAKFLLLEGTGPLKFWVMDDPTNIKLSCLPPQTSEQRYMYEL